MPERFQPQSMLSEWMRSTSIITGFNNKENPPQTKKKTHQPELTLLSIPKLQNLCHFTFKNKITRNSLSQSNTLSLLPTARCLCLPCISYNIHQGSPWDNFRWFSSGLVQSIFSVIIFSRAYKGAEPHHVEEGWLEKPLLQPSKRKPHHLAAVSSGTDSRSHIIPPGERAGDNQFDNFSA